MTVATPGSRQFLFLTILLLGLNLRPILAAIGPLLDQIQQATGLSDSEGGLLTTLPILAMGICALYGGRLQRLLGEYRGILLGITIIAAACLVRWGWHSRSGLLVTATLGGIGIALVQALVPSFIKRCFAQHGSVLMGLYTTGIMAGAAFAAATASPLSVVMQWPGALACWGLLAVIALLAWLMSSAGADSGQHDSGYQPTPFTGTHWLLMIFLVLGPVPIRWCWRGYRRITHNWAGVPPRVVFYWGD